VIIEDKAKVQTSLSVNITGSKIRSSRTFPKEIEYVTAAAKDSQEESTRVLTGESSHKNRENPRTGATLKFLSTGVLEDERRGEKQK